MEIANDDRCSFCGKRRDQVKQLVAGQKLAAQRVFICNECVALLAAQPVIESVDLKGHVRRWPPLRVPGRDD